MINLKRILFGTFALGTLTLSGAAAFIGTAHATPRVGEDYAIASVSLTDPIWTTNPSSITDPLWVTDPYWTTDPLWLTDPIWMDAIDLDETDMIALVAEGQRLPRGAQVVYRDRAGTVVAELEAARGRTLITIVQCDEFFDAAMDELSRTRRWSADSVLVVNPDSMHPDTGRTGSNPTPHP